MLRRHSMPPLVFLSLAVPIAAPLLIVGASLGGNPSRSEEGGVATVRSSAEVPPEGAVLEDAATVEVDLLEVIGWPSGGPFGRDGGGIGAFATAVPVFLRLRTDEGEPAERRDVTLVWDGGRRRLRTDGEGRLRTVLHRDRLRHPRLVVPEGLRVEVDPEHRVRVKTRSITPHSMTPHSMTPGAGSDRVESEARVYRVDAKSLARARSDGVTVAYRAEEGTASVARSILVELGRIRGFTAGLAGLRLANDGGFGVVVLGGDAESGGTVEVEGAAWIPVRAAAWRRDRARAELAPWVWVHEWVEWTLASRGIYAVDPALRAFGDGMAEWIALEYCRAFHPEVAETRIREGVERVDALVRAGRTRYDLPLRFRASVRVGAGPGGADTDTDSDPGDALDPVVAREELAVVAAGYPVALWFWWSAFDGDATGIRDALAVLDEIGSEGGGLTLAGLLERLERRGVESPDVRPPLRRVAEDLALLADRLP